MRRTITATLALVLALGLVAAGCGSSTKASDTATGATSATTSTPVSGSITVSAASSLTGAFGTIKDDFQAANPGAHVTINFGSSGTLETQIESGAPADVAAFADDATMKKLTDKGALDGPSQIFATNHLVIVTKPGNPTHIETLADLASAGTVSLCADTAPCGKYANQILTTAAVSIPAAKVTRGQDVKTTLAAVTNGDADAAIVYVTDAQAAGAQVDTVTIPAEQNAVANYPIAVIKATQDAALAQAFMAFVLGPQGRQVLQDAGFATP